MSPNTAVKQSKKIIGSGEIDLFELIQSLWQEKILIVTITAVVTALALTYALTATPVYRAQTSLVPPLAYAIQGYNEGHIENFKEIEFDIESVYKVFLDNLISSRLRTTFFENIYLPSLSADEIDSNRDNLFKNFNKTITVKPSDSDNHPDLYYVTAELSDPVSAADLVNEYIEMAVSATKIELRKNIEAKKKVRINTLKLQIKSLIEAAKREREDKIKQLKEALYVADSIGLDVQSLQSDKASLGGNRYIDNDLIYTRGAKALRAQLGVLEERASDESFIPGLSGIKTQLEILQAYQLDDTNISVVTIDEAARVSNTPIKPRKILIVAVAVILGGMLGVFAALIRSMLRKRKHSLAE